MQKKHFLSVVVTAYNRKEFLLEALNSVVNQILNRTNYEIICIKNYMDTKIDEFIKENKIRSILKEGGYIGNYFYTALNEAKGDILTFLDDDDIFSRERLERIYDVFSVNDVGFYHNAAYISGKVEYGKIQLESPSNFILISNPYRTHLNLLIKASFNMSSLAIKKNILQKHRRELAQIITSPDSFMLLLSIIEKTGIFIDYNLLSFYRIHSNNVSVYKSTERALNFNEKLVLPTLLFQYNIAKKYNSDTGKLLLGRLVFMTESMLGIINCDRRTLFSSLKHYRFILFDKSSFRRLIAVFIAILGSKYPKKLITQSFN